MVFFVHDFGHKRRLIPDPSMVPHALYFALSFYVPCSACSNVVRVRHYTNPSSSAWSITWITS